MSSAVNTVLILLIGAMLQFGFLAAVFWWVIIAFNMTLEVIFFLPPFIATHNVSSCI